MTESKIIVNFNRGVARECATFPDDERWEIMKVFEYAAEMFSDYFDVKLKRNLEKNFVVWCERYGNDEVENAIYIACEKYDDPVTAISKIGGILYNRASIKRKYFE